MTLDELMKVYDKAASDRAGIRAVVEALRDEFDKNGSVTWTLHQILASDGVDKAAGGGESRQTESIRPAADRIEALEAEVERLQVECAENERLWTEASNLAELNGEVADSAMKCAERLRAALETIAEEHDAGRHDGIYEACPAHEADVMFAIARKALEETKE